MAKEKSLFDNVITKPSGIVNNKLVIEPMKKLINKQKENNKTLSEDLLSSYRKALYKVKEFFDSIDNYDMGEDMTETIKVVTSILATGEKLGKNIETLAILEKKVQQDEQIGNKIRGGAELSLLENEEI